MSVEIMSVETILESDVGPVFEINLSILQKDIDAAKVKLPRKSSTNKDEQRMRINCCPIAQSLNRRGIKNSGVRTFHVAVNMNGRTFTRYYLGAKGEELIKLFDDGDWEKVKPCRITISTRARGGLGHSIRKPL